MPAEKTGRQRAALFRGNQVRPQFQRGIQVVFDVRIIRQPRFRPAVVQNRPAIFTRLVISVSKVVVHGAAADTFSDNAFQIARSHSIVVRSFRRIEQLKSLHKSTFDFSGLCCHS